MGNGKKKDARRANTSPMQSWKTDGFKKKKDKSLVHLAHAFFAPVLHPSDLCLAGHPTNQTAINHSMKTHDRSLKEINYPLQDMQLLKI